MKLEQMSVVARSSAFGLQDESPRWKQKCLLLGRDSGDGVEHVVIVERPVSRKHTEQNRTEGIQPSSANLH